MSEYADTSFFFRLYDIGAGSARAHEHVSRLKEALPVTDLQRFEFLHAVRLRMFRFDQDRKEGLSRKAGSAMMEQFSSHLKGNLFTFRNADANSVFRMADDISARHTREHGYRALDILHVATALHLKAEAFLTFDKNQAILARAEGLATPIQ